MVSTMARLTAMGPSIDGVCKSAGGSFSGDPSLHNQIDPCSLILPRCRATSSDALPILPVSTHVRRHVFEMVVAHQHIYVGGFSQLSVCAEVCIAARRECNVDGHTLQSQLDGPLRIDRACM